MECAPFKISSSIIPEGRRRYKGKSEGKQITIDKQLTITSSDSATLNGNGESRIFIIESKAKGTVIKNIVFKNGHTDNRGGAIYLNASNVPIDSCSFKNCVAHSGGAIATPNNSNADSLTITNSKFTSNHANYVGGAYHILLKNWKFQTVFLTPIILN